MHSPVSCAGTMSVVRVLFLWEQRRGRGTACSVWILWIHSPVFCGFCFVTLFTAPCYRRLSMLFVIFVVPPTGALFLLHQQVTHFKNSFCWQQFAAGRSRRPRDWFRSNAKLLENMVITVKESGQHSYADLLGIQRQGVVLLPLQFTRGRSTRCTYSARQVQTSEWQREKAPVPAVSATLLVFTLMRLVA
jgi:hypothetical protein